MTQEEIAKVKAMSIKERKAHFTPLFRMGKITYAQFSYVTSLPLDDDSDPQAHSSLNDEDAINELARLFGGYVVPDASQKLGNSWEEIQKAKMAKS